MADAAHTQFATPSATRTAWDEAYSAYLARKLLHDADRRFGCTAIAEADYAMVKADLQSEYGAGWKGAPAAAPLHAQAWEALHVAEKESWRLYGEPFSDAEAALLNTPAPDLDAVAIKVELLSDNSFGLHELGRPAFEIIAADVERLTGVAA